MADRTGRGMVRVAAIAERSKLTVLHADKDCELIADITGQPMDRLQFEEC
ncbi:hypothetical protein [Nocardia sp. NPDC058666]